MKKTFKINKISRDRDYINMQNDDMIVTLKVNLSPDEKRQYFKSKLLEETMEVLEAKDESELIEELADCLEVVDGFAKLLNISMEKILEKKDEKRKKRGGFEDVVILDTVSMQDDHFQAEIFSSQPHKYPQV